MTDQQESRDAVRVPATSIGDPALLARKRKLELSRVDVLRQLDAARAEAHRKMLEQALRALDDQLKALG